MTMARDNLAKSAKPSPRPQELNLIFDASGQREEGKGRCGKEILNKAQAKGKVAKPLAKKGTKPTHVTPNPRPGIT